MKLRFVAAPGRGGVKLRFVAAPGGDGVKLRFVAGVAACALAGAAVAWFLAPAPDQVASGERVYQAYCFQCHEGEGIGSRLTRAGLASYGTAELLFRYNRDFMPYGGERSLTEQQYLDVTAYLLAKYAFVEPGFRLRRGGGSEIPLASAEAR